MHFLKRLSYSIYFLNCASYRFNGINLQINTLVVNNIYLTHTKLAKIINNLVLYPWLFFASPQKNG